MTSLRSFDHADYSAVIVLGQNRDWNSQNACELSSSFKELRIMFGPLLLNVAMVKSSANNFATHFRLCRLQRRHWFRSESRLEFAKRLRTFFIVQRAANHVRLSLVKSCYGQIFSK